MILVDSSVWVDYFNGKDTHQTQKLDALLGVEPLGIGDLILTEVLQGFRADSDYKQAKKMLTSLNVFNMLLTSLPSFFSSSSLFLCCSSSSSFLLFV